MSSTALQTPAGLPTPTRHHTSSRSSPTREGYHATKQTQQQQQQQASTTSLASSSRPSRKSSSGGNSNNNHPNNSGAFSSPVNPAAAVNAATVSMPDYSQPSPSASSERRRHVPPVAPARTSSSRYDQQAPASSMPANSGSRRSTAVAGTGSASAQMTAIDSPRRHRDSRGTPNGSSSTQESSHRRQRAQAATQDEHTHRKTTTSRATTSSLPVRTASSAAPASSHTPQRENSEILNAMVVSQDEIDIERERTRSLQAHSNQDTDVDSADAVPPPIVSHNAAHDPIEDHHRGTRSRHDHSRREKQMKFGEYILGNTIGEGEFGKVKLGWKQEGGVQVAIKLIKKDTLGNNPTRMAKIMREVNILRQLNHPNIVQLHKMEESEHHYGIVLEYASGGELFDYILNHRYLKDHAARRLFAQLISGVGYLHKKGIVHRDLKLENLLLDRNRNIIITDFGFANTFEPAEELTEDEEANLVDREWVKRMGFDLVKPNGMRKADLMQTSCGSPCYAAPELVVSDSLYTGRKVDVWSCGVILYAMLAGYLPFDDDPKNPEGDNINLLYKYIVNTPLTFPEYVTPHARDLLRRILVPDPRQRADLFEVARHSWLSEYANVVEFITSSNTQPADIQNMTPGAEEYGESSMARSASVRESSKKAATSTAIGGLTSKQGTVDPEAEIVQKQQKDNKRRTVQVEYVAPTTQTQRGEANAQLGGPSGANHFPEIRQRQRTLTQNPKETRDVLQVLTGIASGGRPVTGGSMASTGSRTAPPRAPIGQPTPPTVAGTNAHGKIQQPTSSSGRNYISSPQDASSFGRPSVSVAPKFAQVPGVAGGNGERASTPLVGEAKGHRRSNTLGDITDKLLGRSGSIFSGKNRKRPEHRQSVGGDKLSRRYPPVSMSNTAASVQTTGADEPRASMDSTARQSRRSFTTGLGKKRSGSIEAGSQSSQEKQQNRRFSILPTSFSRKAVNTNKDDDRSPDSQLDLPIQEPAAGTGLVVSDDETDAEGLTGGYEEVQQQPQQQQQRQGSRQSHEQQRPPAGRHTLAPAGHDTQDNVQRSPPLSAPYQTASDGTQVQDPRRASSRGGRVVLQKNKRLVDAYDTDDFAKHHDRSGSSGAARRVMDFFRRRGKARGGDE
ncbi:serine/threonine-protein kinase [Grosmannia clavigera kw1407]|uniref:non-specific serine/threonine protein kinase n=1 Tax=Grosmannia clavigera (strain kw1407 / UAMH 11150) TaxID=655863 RepID=F0XU51_GROCL|nr:serine/threonine-protein kinase [Grosmannia clavigera kw1407]EFW98602.1 serine/threonine-protein kinase [Grosmannia clavigera kw1407]